MRAERTAARSKFWLGQVLLGLMSSISACSGAPPDNPATFGMHVHSPATIPVAATAGFNALRVWDLYARWADIEPERGVYRLDRIENILIATEKARQKVILVLGSTPSWASARPDEKCAYGLGCAAEPANLDDWRRYVGTVARKFRGRIECYEPWNEVSFPTDPAFTRAGDGGDAGQFFSGSIASMVGLARVAYEEIRAGDPGACILSPSFHSTGDWDAKFDRFLAAGGKQYIDVVSQHFYYANEPEDAVPIIRSMRRIMAKHGMADTPLWNTEVGTSLFEIAKQRSNMQPEELVYAFMLRTYLLNLSEGVARVYWYAWDNGNMGFREPVTGRDFGSRAAAAALEVVNGADSIRCSANGQVWSCIARNKERDFSVIWVSGKDAKPVQVRMIGPATRWRSAGSEVFKAGDVVTVDGRPVVMRGP